MIQHKRYSRVNSDVSTALVEYRDGKLQSKDTAQIFYEWGHCKLKNELSNVGTSPKCWCFKTFLPYLKDFGVCNGCFLLQY